MSRKYQPFISGLLTAGVTNVATTFSSAGLADLIAVSGSERVVIVLDPDQVDGDPEIVWISAHTALATSATIIRGQEGTTARSHLINTVWRHVVTDVDFERLDTIEADVTSLDGRLDTAESDITALEAVDTATDVRLDAVEANSWVTTARINDAAVTDAKRATAKRVRWRRTSAQNADTNVVWNAEDEDTLGHVAAVGETFTVPAGEGGIYAITFLADPSGHGTNGDDYCFITAGGRQFMGSRGLTHSGEGVHVGVVIPLAAADTVVAQYQVGSTGDTVNATALAWLWITKLGN